MRSDRLLDPGLLRGVSLQPQHGDECRPLADEIAAIGGRAAVCLRAYLTDQGLAPSTLGSESVDTFARTAQRSTSRRHRESQEREKPGDLPIQMPIQVPLIINLRTANALGLDVPLGLLNAADEIIE